MSNDCTVHLCKKNLVTYRSNHKEQNFIITLVDTGLHTMTGGRIKRIEPFITTDKFMVTYGDGLANIDISALMNYHNDHGKIATLTATKAPSRYGILQLAKNNKVLKFQEKVQVDWINGGFLVFNKQVFNYLDENCVLEKEPMQELADKGELMAFPHNGFWIGIDTYREFEMLNDMWEKKNVPWKVWN